MLQLPRALKLVQVFGAHAAHVFLQHGQQLESAIPARRRTMALMSHREPQLVEKFGVPWEINCARPH
jgi:hypothetical protein